MADPTLDDGNTTHTFRPGQFVVTDIPDIVRQRKHVSTDGTARVYEVSTTDGREIVVGIRGLPTSDETHSGTTYSGRDSLRTFLTSTANWAETVLTLTDTDGDSYSVRYWDDEFALNEPKRDVWRGQLTFRIEV